MQNIIHLLGLLRFDAPRLPERAVAAADAYAAWVESHRGYLIDRSAQQLMVCLPDAGETLASLHGLMHEGDHHGFTVAGGLVQAIKATEHLPRSPQDFTERTLETLIEIAGSVSPQQIGISPKLLSLLQLAVPEYADHFEPGLEAPGRVVTRVRTMLVMRSETLPLYDGDFRIADALVAPSR